MKYGRGLSVILMVVVVGVSTGCATEESRRAKAEAAHQAEMERARRDKERDMLIKKYEEEQLEAKRKKKLEDDNKRSLILSTTPRCINVKECEVKWGAARNWVLTHSDMKLQHVMPDYLETYSPAATSGSLHFQVFKTASKGPDYTITIKASCAGSSCTIEPLDAELDFNTQVNKSW